LVGETRHSQSHRGLKPRGCDMASQSSSDDSLPGLQKNDGGTPARLR
jgi:hypothetical protein